MAESSKKVLIGRSGLSISQVGLTFLKNIEVKNLRQSRRLENVNRSKRVSLVPKLKLGNAVSEAPASCLQKTGSWSFQGLGSQPGGWEPA